MQHVGAADAADAADILSRFGSWIGWVFPSSFFFGEKLNANKRFGTFFLFLNRWLQ